MAIFHVVFCTSNSLHQKSVPSWDYGGLVRWENHLFLWTMASSSLCQITGRFTVCMPPDSWSHPPTLQYTFNCNVVQISSQFTDNFLAISSAYAVGLVSCSCLLVLFHNPIKCWCHPHVSVLCISYLFISFPCQCESPCLCSSTSHSPHMCVGKITCWLTTMFVDWPHRLIV